MPQVARGSAFFVRRKCCMLPISYSLPSPRSFYQSPCPSSKLESDGIKFHTLGFYHAFLKPSEAASRFFSRAVLVISTTRRAFLLFVFHISVSRFTPRSVVIRESSVAGGSVRIVRRICFRVGLCHLSWCIYEHDY